VRCEIKMGPRFRGGDAMRFHGLAGWHALGSGIAPAIPEPPMRHTLTLLAATLALSACTFVKMGPGAEQVRVIRADQDTSGCVVRGEVAVSVKDRLGPYERNEIRIIDELETLARNEAPGLGADTVQPLGPPKDGEQRWRALRCNAGAG